MSHSSQRSTLSRLGDDAGGFVALDGYFWTSDHALEDAEVAARLRSERDVARFVDGVGGGYVIARWDPRERRLVIARDGAGSSAGLTWALWVSGLPRSPILSRRMTAQRWRHRPRAKRRIRFHGMMDRSVALERREAWR